VDVDIDPSKIAPMAGREVAQSVVTGSYTYRSDGRAGALVFSRLGVTPRHPWDVRSYLAANATFPTTSTLSQLYDDAEFEAYRAMGETTGRFILEKVPAAESDVGAQRSAVRTGPS
jgi:hypothetical protein